ncbi:Hydroxyacylglutathione hydrolase [Oxalobacteraceae bacterium IMCC9480]|nr:Hydroxyacylglutathione hydrolase [Oxalobacteraceae bacterium IMCC9480]NDP60635.1 hydroxyacylglutathione hydrolase [Oxalobacteraceae bacterium]
MATLQVLTIPAFDDNYLWLVHDGVHAAVVDPGDAGPILAALALHQLSLVAILLTHHHADHVGGVPELLQHASVPVYGPRHEKIPTITHPLVQGDTVVVPELQWQLGVLDVPGHTSGHIAYFAAAEEWLFCGDTLFAGGCGRLFEGTPEQMDASLQKLAALPGRTSVFCAHEYTMANLRFAQAVEPGNVALQERIVREQDKRDRHIPTVPSTIALERETNPFLRWREADIRHSLQQAGKLGDDTGIAGFAALRAWKNSYR